MQIKDLLYKATHVLALFAVLNTIQNLPNVTELIRRTGLNS